MNGPWGHYAKWNKADRDHKYHIISLIRGIQTHTHTHKPIKKKTKETSSQIQRTDGWLSGAGVGEMGEGGQKVHTFRGIHL